MNLFNEIIMRNEIFKKQKLTYNNSFKKLFEILILFLIQIFNLFYLRKIECISINVYW